MSHRGKSGDQFVSGAHNIICWFCRKKLKSTQATRIKNIWYCPGCVDKPNRLFYTKPERQFIKHPQQDPPNEFVTFPINWEDIGLSWEFVDANWEDIGSKLDIIP